MSVTSSQHHRHDHGQRRPHLHHRPHLHPRSGLLVMVLVLVALLASACSGLASSSDVQPGRRVDEQVGQRTRIIVSAPSKGASQDVIARDFIRSGASFQETDVHQQVVGRAYLAPSSVDRWKPTSSVTVYDAPTAMAIEHLPADQVRLTVSAVATIDEGGHYIELAPGTRSSIVFAMERVDGEWRIVLPASGFGLWINTDDFDQVFRDYAIHYVVPGSRHLVSDVRWFPSGPRGVTALARAQLGPVPGYLGGVADTDVPGATSLAIDAVAVSSQGVATVTLTTSGQVDDPDRRRGMWAQFVATLREVPGVSAVTLAVQDIGTIAVPDLPDAVSSLDDLGYEDAPAPARTVAMMRTDQGVDLVNLQQVLANDSAQPAGTPLPGNPGPLRIPADYVDLALSPDGHDVAGVASGRGELVRWRDGATITLPYVGDQLTNPEYDTDGRLWVAGRVKAASMVWTYLASAATPSPAVPVAAPWLTGRTIVQVAPSPDGTRLAVLSRTGVGRDDRLDIAGIVRDAAGSPTALATPYRQGQPLLGFLDVTWVNPLTLAVLARDLPGDALRPFLVSIGKGVGLRRVGQLSREQLLIPEVLNARSITSKGSESSLIVMTSTGAELRVGPTWSAVGEAREIIVAAS